MSPQDEHGPRVLLLCGGRSAEHEVSLASARSVLAATAGRVAWRPRVMDRAGRWLSADASAAVLAQAITGPAPDAPDGPLLDLEALAAADVVFPLLHGPYGEDGRLQGALEMLGVPYVGSGVLGSAVAMDKLVMKGLLASAGLPQVAYLGLSRQAWRQDPEAAAAKAEALGWPLFVKPANLGSSIGVSRVDGPWCLQTSLAKAFEHDRRVIVEAAASGARELEVAVLGVDGPEASVVGEIRFQSAFYDYETKYTDDMAELLVPAPIPASVAERCRELALAAFTAVDAAGLARVDFFWSEADDRLWVNEINTIPGFTATSMYPRLWQASGLPYADLALELIRLSGQQR